MTEPNSQVRCNDCGRLSFVDANYCWNCGRKLRAIMSPENLVGGTLIEFNGKYDP